MRPLIDQARSFSSQPECPRDNPTADSLWHYIPDLPDLTVCPACYAETILPSLRSSPSALATLFTRTPAKIAAPPTPYGRPPALGPTCQLYSARMRGVWEEAVQRGDVEGLVRRMRERREVEERCWRRRCDLEGLLAGTGAGVDGYAREMLGRDLREVGREWEGFE